MTSCDRWDLFQQTIDSFFKLNTYPYVAFHVHNDSVQTIPQQIKDKYSDKGITWHEGTKRGLSAAWDYLVALVETEYFFNLEDDWLFEGNPNFIQDSINVIGQGYNQVWIRAIKDHTHPFIKTNRQYIVGGKEIKLLDYDGDWCGFTFNPSVRRKIDWEYWFPDGISGKDEIELSRKLMDMYYTACSLVDSACRHIGNGRHTKDFKI